MELRGMGRKKVMIGVVYVNPEGVRIGGSGVCLR